MRKTSNNYPLRFFKTKRQDRKLSVVGFFSALFMFNVYTSDLYFWFIFLVLDSWLYIPGMVFLASGLIVAYS